MAVTTDLMQQNLVVIGQATSEIIRRKKKEKKKHTSVKHKPGQLSLPSSLIKGKNMN